MGEERSVSAEYRWYRVREADEQDIEALWNEWAFRQFALQNPVLVERGLPHEVVLSIIPKLRETYGLPTTLRCSQCGAETAWEDMGVSEGDPTHNLPVRRLVCPTNGCTAIGWAYFTAV
jgi:hypothetical protein